MIFATFSFNSAVVYSKAIQRPLYSEQASRPILVQGLQLHLYQASLAQFVE